MKHELGHGYITFIGQITDMDIKMMFHVSMRIEQSHPL